MNGIGERLVYMHWEEHRGSGWFLTCISEKACPGLKTFSRFGPQLKGAFNGAP